MRVQERDPGGDQPPADRFRLGWETCCPIEERRSTQRLGSRSPIVARPSKLCWSARIIRQTNRALIGVRWSRHALRSSSTCQARPERLLKRLIEAGLNEQTPCLIISKVSLSGEQACRTTLETLCGSVQLPAPCLLIVGETVAASIVADS